MTDKQPHFFGIRPTDRSSRHVPASNLRACTCKIVTTLKKEPSVTKAAVSSDVNVPLIAFLGHTSRTEVVTKGHIYTFFCTK